MKRVRVAVVGLGLAGYELHLKGYHAVPEAEVVALCSRDAGKLARAAREFGVPKTYSSYEKLLDDEGVDAVSICVIDSLHFEYAKMALEHGKHVLCEKPVTTTVEDARRLIELARSASVKFGVGQVYRFVPQFERMRALLRQGTIGTLFHVDCDYRQDMRRHYEETPWRRDDKSWNSWIAGGVHVVDLVRWVAGEVEEVMMYGNKGEEDPQIGPLTDNHVCIMKLRGGATCKIWEVRSIKQSPEFTIDLALYGGRGTASGNLLRNEVAVYRAGAGGAKDEAIDMEVEKSALIPVRRELRDFVSSILTDGEPRCGLVDGAATLSTVAAAERSLRSGLPEKVEPVQWEQ